MSNSLVSITLDLLNAYPSITNLDCEYAELLGVISYILDSKHINSREGFENYIYLTNTLNKLLTLYYHPKVVNTPLFKPDGILLLLNKDDNFYSSNEFLNLRTNRKVALLRQFPTITSLLECLQYQEDLIQ